MSSITFLYQGMPVQVKYSKGEKLDSIVQRFCIKVNIDKDKIILLYMGSVLDLEMTEDKMGGFGDKREVLVVEKEE